MNLWFVHLSQKTRTHLPKKSWEKEEVLVIEGLYVAPLPRHLMLASRNTGRSSVAKWASKVRHLFTGCHFCDCSRVAQLTTCPLPLRSWFRILHENEQRTADSHLPPIYVTLLWTSVCTQWFPYEYGVAGLVFRLTKIMVVRHWPYSIFSWQQSLFRKKDNCFCWQNSLTSIFAMMNSLQQKLIIGGEKLGCFYFPHWHNHLNLDKRNQLKVIVRLMQFIIKIPDVIESCVFFLFSVWQ